MEAITTTTFYHRQKFCIGLHFKHHAKLCITVCKQAKVPAKKTEAAKIISNKIQIPDTSLKKAIVNIKKPGLNKANAENLQAYVQILNLKGYCSSTQRTYVNEFTQFLSLIGKINAADFTVARI